MRMIGGNEPVEQRQDALVQRRVGVHAQPERAAHVLQVEHGQPADERAGGRILGGQQVAHEVPARALGRAAAGRAERLGGVALERLPAAVVDAVVVAAQERGQSGRHSARAVAQGLPREHRGELHHADAAGRLRVPARGEPDGLEGGRHAGKQTARSARPPSSVPGERSDHTRATLRARGASDIIARLPGEARDDAVTVLVVDDNREFREVLREVVEATPSMTCVGDAISGEAALAALPESWRRGS